MPLVFVGTAKSSDKRGIIKTYKNPTVQPASFVLFEVGNQVFVKNYVKDGSSFREFTQNDATQYFPTAAEMASLGQDQLFSPLNIGAPLIS